MEDARDERRGDGRECGLA